MTLIELVTVFDARRRLFLGTLAFVFLLTLALAQFQPPNYTNELLLWVTRTSVASTTEYAYDHFYRLQADERIADSLSQYLGSATGKRDVAERAKLDTRAYTQYTGSKLKTVRLGTNLIKLEYKTENRLAGEALGEALTATANEYIFLLNEDARQKEWFTVMGKQPVIQSAAWDWPRVGIVGLVAGFFIAFWAVLLQYFWQRYQTWRKAGTR